LRLKFEPEERKWDKFQNTFEPIAAADPVTVSTREPEAPLEESIELNALPVQEELAEPGPSEIGRLIEFPRYSPPVSSADELAEPVVERPRIVEVPEVVSAAPALGGIILEPEESDTGKRPEFEIPLQTPNMARRIAAGAVDGLIVLAACVLFAYIVLKLTAFIPPLSQLLGLVSGIAGTFWAGYQYLLLVHTGSTPGLRLVHLRLSHFDGSSVPRPVRRWRVLASILSAASLGLGFAWCYLDEDALCWHDRITRTYLVSSR
jgi:uncharacterized RDD family membrane protein YckC